MTYETKSQVEAINVTDSINNYLNICYDSLNENSSIVELQGKLENRLCDIGSCIMYYEISEILGIDSLNESYLVDRILEINEKYYENGTPLFLCSKGGFSGGIFTFDRVTQGDFQIIKITTPHTCVSTEMDDKRKKIYSLINQHSTKLINK